MRKTFSQKTKDSFKKFSLSFILILSISWFLFLKCPHDAVIPLTYNPNLFKNGDLIFRKGKGIFSDFFSSIGSTNSPYSHVGIIRKTKNNIFVIHTEANELTGRGFAREDYLTDFLNDKNSASAALYRVKGVDDYKRQSVVLTALGFVKNKISFDVNFNLDDDKELYCTELVYLAFKTNGIAIIKQPSLFNVQVLGINVSKKVITIDQFLKSNRIQFITKLK